MRKLLRTFFLGGLLSASLAAQGFVPPPGFGTAASPPTTISPMLLQFLTLSLSWLAISEIAATGLFALLAIGSFGVSAIRLSLQRGTIGDWAVEIVKRLWKLLAMWTLLLLGPPFMAAVVASYSLIGSQASGVPSIQANDLAADGIDLVTAMSASALGLGLLDIYPALLLAFCAVAIGWGFFKLVKGYVMAKIESYIAIYVAAVQLGWGGSEYTQVYSERYVGACIASGVKLLVFYFIVAVERSLITIWSPIAAAINVAQGEFTPVITLTVSVVIFCAIADPDKLAALIYNGTPQFSAHDVTNAYMPHVNTAITAGTAVATMGMGMASRGVFASGSAGGAAANALIPMSQTSSNTYTASRPQSTPPPNQRT